MLKPRRLIVSPVPPAAPAEAAPTQSEFTVEPFEPRLLLSASLANGVLTVTGSANADTITIDRGPAVGQVIITGDPDSPAAQTFSAVGSIVVNAAAGNDDVR